MLGLGSLGVLGIILLIVLALFVPVIITILVGIAFANYFGFTGVSWWAFVILFYIIISAILSFVGV